MTSALTVVIGIDRDTLTLRLNDEFGRYVAAHQVSSRRDQVDLWRMAFGISLHSEDLPIVASFIGETVLGPITNMLASSMERRGLIIHIDSDNESSGTALALLGTKTDTKTDWRIGAALARVPWELALAPDGRSLRDHNIVVSVAPRAATDDLRLDLGSDQELRVLLVFADGSCSRTLREALRETFFRDILPTRNVTFDMMTIGVTAENVYQKVQRGGYHILFLAGSVIPDVHKLADLIMVAGSPIPLVVLVDTSQNTGNIFHAAHASAALAVAGAHQVVTTRWPINLKYAVPWCSAFFKALLRDTYPVSSAVTFATSDVLRQRGDYDPLDQAAFVVLGGGQVEFHAYGRRGDQVERRDPKPTPILPGGACNLDRPKVFCGRHEELGRLLVWMEDGGPIMVLCGPENIGKTTLTAEATHLCWEGRFDFVLASQGHVKLDGLFRHLHNRLLLASRSYRKRCTENSMEAIHLDPSSGLTGAHRFTTMAENLVTALTMERVLLVLDGIQGSWLSSGEFCDRAVEETLCLLADRLVSTGSRILITTRRWPTDIIAEVMNVGPFDMSDAVVVTDHGGSEALVVRTAHTDASLAGR